MFERGATVFIFSGCEAYDFVECFAGVGRVSAAMRQAAASICMLSKFSEGTGGSQVGLIGVELDKDYHRSFAGFLPGPQSTFVLCQNIPRYGQH